MIGFLITHWLNPPRFHKVLAFLQVWRLLWKETYQAQVELKMIKMNAFLQVWRLLWKEAYQAQVELKMIKMKEALVAW